MPVLASVIVRFSLLDPIASLSEGEVSVCLNDRITGFVAAFYTIQILVRGSYEFCLLADKGWSVARDHHHFTSAALVAQALRSMWWYA